MTSKDPIFPVPFLSDLGPRTKDKGQRTKDLGPRTSPDPIINPLHDLVLEVDQPFFVLPPVLRGVAKRGEGDDVDFDGKAREAGAVGVADATAGEEFGDDGDRAGGVL